MNYNNWNAAGPSSSSGNMDWDQPAHNLTEYQQAAIFDCIRRDVTDPTAIAIAVGVAPYQVEALLYQQQQIQRQLNRPPTSTATSPWGDQSMAYSGDSSAYPPHEDAQALGQNPPDFDYESFLNDLKSGPYNNELNRQDYFDTPMGGPPASAQAQPSSYSSSLSSSSSEEEDNESLFGDTRYDVGAPQTEPSGISPRHVPKLASGSQSLGNAFNMPGETAESPGGTVYTAVEGLALRTGQFAGISADKERFLLDRNKTGFNRKGGLRAPDTVKGLRQLFDEQTGLTSITRAERAVGVGGLAAAKSDLRKAQAEPSPWPRSGATGSAAPAPHIGAAAPQPSTSNAAAPVYYCISSGGVSIPVTEYEHSAPGDRAMMRQLNGFKRGKDDYQNKYLITPEGQAYRLAIPGRKRTYPADAAKALRDLQAAANKANPPVPSATLGVLFGMSTSWLKRK